MTSELISVTSLAKNELHFLAMSGDEEMGRPFEFIVDVIGKNPAIKLADALGQTMTVTVQQSSDMRFRHLGSGTSSTTLRPSMTQTPNFVRTGTRRLALLCLYSAALVLGACTQPRNTPLQLPPIDAGDAGTPEGGGPDAGPCTAGDVRCQSDGKTPEKCVGGSWQPQTACPMACASGACSTCAPNTVRCGPNNVPQKCKADGSGYADQLACPAAKPMCDGTTGMCTVACTPNDKRCSPTGPVIQQCDLQAIWRDTTTCQYACAGSGATTACGGSCQPQTRSCGDNQTPYLCDATGTNQPQTACPSVCSGAGQCGGDCKPYAARCAAGSTMAQELCDATGHWGPGVTCAYTCDSTMGRCAGECAPGGSAQCSGNSVRTCSSTGHWMVTTICTSSTCSLGQCRPCTSGEHQCNNGKPQTCNGSGVWMDDQASACAYICDATMGKCAGQCIPDSDACADGQTSKHCKGDGTYASIACANVCDQATGRCGGVCVPNSHRCNGGTAQTCGPDGQWGAGVACASGCDATTGQCAACADDPLSVTCMGGKCGPTSNNCGRTVTCSSPCAGVGASCGGGGVSGVCGCRPEPMTQTCQSGALCGSVMNNCGQAVACGDTCVAPQTCGGGTSPNLCGCTPKTAAIACTGKNCDAVSDGCGGTVSCGSCTAPQICGVGGTPNVCGCTPKKATDVCGTRVCGTMPDGCGGNVTCGPNCSNGQFCSNGMCVASCTPMTACPTGKSCGTIDNGCGTGTLTCGTMNGNCPTGQTCMGGSPGVANVCGCTPMTMTAACAGKNCDTVSDGCSGTINCGSCTTPQTCAGAGTANVCGCTPKTKTQACTGGKNCGPVADGCGGNVDCGSCTAPQTCSGGGMVNVCGCTPLTAAQACPAGQTCNTASDSCGGSVSCGTCTGTGQTCGGGGTPNKCGCTPATSCGAGTNCGTKADGCGGTLTCGTATCGTGTGQQCGAVTANVCGCARNAMAVSCSSKCGTVNDNCGAAVNCGTTNCSGGQVCAQAPASPTNVCCTPETDPQMCSRLVRTCGPVTATDNCGTSRTIASCGTCTGTGQACGASGVCGCVAESDSAFCTRLGKTCGSVTATDNCGASRSVASCGTCSGNQVCEASGAPAPNTCCMPQADATICSNMGKNCNSLTVTDNCGTTRTVGCGTCTAPKTCAGGSPSVPNVCGCTSEINSAFCTRLGKNCGSVTANDNCGIARTVTSCGTCTGTGQACGVSNVCCTPLTATQACTGGQNCGTAPDGCGGNVSCGTCTTTGQTCQSGRCACPASAPNLCPGVCTNINGSDAANCGACGHTCLGGACAAGACQPVAVATNLSASAVVFGVDATFVYFSAGSPLLSNAAFRVSKTAVSGTPTSIVSGIAASFPGVILDVMLMRFGGTTPPTLKTCSVSNCVVPASAFMTGDDVIPFRTLVPTVFSTSVNGGAGSGSAGPGTAALDFNWWGAASLAAHFHADVFNEGLPFLTLFAGDSRVFWTNSNGSATSLFVSDMSSTNIFGLAMNLPSTPLLTPVGLRIVDANPQSVLLLSSSSILYRVPMLPFGTNGSGAPVQVAAVGGSASAFAGATEDATRIYWLDGAGTVATQQGTLASGQTPPGGFYQDATALYWGRGSPNAVMRLAK